MPSASAKLEKQASTEAVDPLRQAITVIEHKIRNLEKRKVKLESYKEEQKNGKDLNSDQYTAVAKYDEVIQTLEFARELNKNFSGIAADAAKALKKQQRKEQLERAQQEINRVKEILVIQEVLLNVGQDSVREDFLAAKNGAAQLTVDEIKYLDDLYLLLSPKHIPEENMPPYQEQLTHAAEHLINLVEGRSKEVVGTTYAGLKELITKIHTCGYFDQNPEEEEEVVAAEEVAEEVTIPQEEAPMEGYVDPCGVSQETLKANLVAAIPDVLPPQAAPIAPSSVIPPEASFFTPPVPTSNVVPSNVPSDFPPHPAPSAPPMQQPVQGHALPDTFDSGFDFIQESQLEVDATAPPHVDLAGMLVQQPPGGGHPPVPPSHFRPARPQPTPTGAPAPPPSSSLQTSQLAPVVAEFVASVSAATPPIPSQTFTNQNFSIIPVPGSAQPVVASPTPGMAPPNFPEASAPVSAQMVPTPQAAPNAQHIPGFARVPSNSFQGSVQSHPSNDGAPSQPISIPMPQQRVPEESEYAATSAAPFVPASVAQSTYSGQGQPSQAFVPQQQAMGQARFANTYGDTSHVSATGDPSNEKARFGTTDLSGETTEDADLQTGTSWADTSQEEVFVQQNQSQRGGYGNRGGRGMNRGGRGNSNGYNGRGRGNYSNGRGGYSGYRGNQEGGNQYYQNGYQQRDNYGNNSGGSGGGYGNGGYAKSGPRGGGGGAAGNGGTQRTNRGRGGQGRGANMRGGGRGGSYVRGGGGGGNKQ
ncbi:caprin-1-like isoform X2 [Ischnura elegans]|uniref:caprin-1-like isoform X2 n=1 Tax=Ischnura elegans TaxID=197161 RepID=UPI001ED8B9F8|nr:caprin-1-like isoform X2 [Ischnura elegans]